MGCPGRMNTIYPHELPKRLKRVRSSHEEERSSFWPDVKGAKFGDRIGDRPTAARSISVATQM